MTARNILLGVLAMWTCADLMFATTIKAVNLDDLFHEADVVALVAVTGADSSAFKVAVYRAQVVQGFKGAADKSTIFFGPYDTYALGHEYVVFLRRSNQNFAALSVLPPNPWPASAHSPYLEIMYAGYTVLPVDHTCVIPGCADGVSVPSSQVHLSGSIEVFHHQCDPGSNYDSWVRKNTFLAILSALARGNNK